MVYHSETWKLEIADKEGTLMLVSDVCQMSRSGEDSNMPWLGFRYIYINGGRFLCLWEVKSVFHSSLCFGLYYDTLEVCPYPLSSERDV